MQNTNLCKFPNRSPNSEASLIVKSLKFFTITIVVVWTLSYIFESLFYVDKLYFTFLVGFLCSAQATYYKYKVWMDPNYRPIDCYCTEQKSITQDIMMGILTVLDHKKGSLLFNIPNSVYGILFYSILIFMKLSDQYGSLLITRILISFGSLGSLYLWYIMVFEVRSVCLLCATIYSVNFLIFINMF